MSEDALARRYGAPHRWRRIAMVAVVAALAAVALVWLVLTAWYHSTPEARSELVGFEIVDEHTVEVRVRVTVSHPDVAAVCRVQAIAEDKTPVGDLTWDPADQQGIIDELTVRTTRRATSVERVGCTTPDQPRPR